MTERSSTDELERRAEEERARIRHTAEELGGRLTPGQLMDEVLHYFCDSDGSGMLHNLKGQARDNPMALAMMGAGMAWLMAGPGYQPRRHDGAEDGGDYASDARIYGRAAYPGSNGGAAASGDGLGERMSRTAASAKGAASNARDTASASAREAGEAAREAWHAAGDRAGSMSDAAARRARQAGDSMSHAASDMADDAARYARRGGDMFADLMEREPLVLGAIGLAVGAALGAGLPSTRTEDEYFGPVRDDLKHEAEGALKKGAGKAREAAGKAAAAARHEADRQGLTPGDKPLAERGAKVAKAAKDAAKDEAKRAAPKGRAGGAKPTG